MLVAGDRSLDRVESKVRQAVQASDRAYTPAQLIQHLSTQGEGEDLVRVAVWYLLDEHEIALTPDWKLAAIRR